MLRLRSRFAALAAVFRDPDEADWEHARRMRDRGTLLSFLIPSLSTQHLVVTQIVDRKNADEWALVLAVAGCFAVSYISRLRSAGRRRRARDEQASVLPESVTVTVGKIRAALRLQAMVLVMLPLALSTPWAASTIVGRRNVEEWMCFFGVLTLVEVWRAARIWKESTREIRGQLAELVETMRGSRPAERHNLELQLGRRVFGRLERMECATLGSEPG